MVGVPGFVITFFTLGLSGISVETGNSASKTGSDAVPPSVRYPTPDRSVLAKSSDCLSTQASGSQDWGDISGLKKGGDPKTKSHRPGHRQLQTLAVSDEYMSGGFLQTRIENLGSSYISSSVYRNNIILTRGLQINDKNNIVNSRQKRQSTSISHRERLQRIRRLRRRQQRQRQRKPKKEKGRKDTNTVKVENLDTTQAQVTKANFRKTKTGHQATPRKILEITTPGQETRLQFVSESSIIDPFIPATKAFDYLSSYESVPLPKKRPSIPLQREIIKPIVTLSGQANGGYIVQPSTTPSSVIDNKRLHLERRKQRREQRRRERLRRRNQRKGRRKLRTVPTPTVQGISDAENAMPSKTPLLKEQQSGQNRPVLLSSSDERSTVRAALLSFYSKHSSQNAEISLNQGSQNSTPSQNGTTSQNLTVVNPKIPAESEYGVSNSSSQSGDDSTSTVPLLKDLNFSPVEFNVSNQTEPESLLGSFPLTGFDDDSHLVTRKFEKIDETTHNDVNQTSQTTTMINSTYSSLTNVTLNETRGSMTDSSKMSNSSQNIPEVNSSTMSNISVANIFTTNPTFSFSRGAPTRPFRPTVSPAAKRWRQRLLKLRRRQHSKNDHPWSSHSGHAQRRGSLTITSPLQDTALLSSMASPWTTPTTTSTTTSQTTIIGSSDTTTKVKEQQVPKKKSPFIGYKTAYDFLSQQTALHGREKVSEHRREANEFNRHFGEGMCELFNKHYVTTGSGGRCD